MDVCQCVLKGDSPLDYLGHTNAAVQPKEPSNQWTSQVEIYENHALPRLGQRDREVRSGCRFAFFFNRTRDEDCVRIRRQIRKNKVGAKLTIRLSVAASFVPKHSEGLLPP